MILYSHKKKQLLLFMSEHDIKGKVVKKIAKYAANNYLMHPIYAIEISDALGLYLAMRYEAGVPDEPNYNYLWLGSFTYYFQRSWILRYPSTDLIVK